MCLDTTEGERLCVRQTGGFTSDLDVHESTAVPVQDHQLCNHNDKPLPRLVCNTSHWICSS